MQFPPSISYLFCRVFFIKLELCVGGKKRILLIFHTELSGYSWREKKNAGVYKGKKNWPIIVGKYKKNAGFTKKHSIYHTALEFSDQL